ncbi:GNAT family N-acetyltransferase [Catelliglobosispora koreensis]|uniref:GNAT family N-acetyltransferase n=1 Tax=Catelliglobosispora koreensis TaxID=129052 RepID=UPI000369D34F|nr:GNAT family N-acetyltransferase [Catelliglobosispora koreensis]
MDFSVRRLKPGEWRDYRNLRLEALEAEPLAFVEQYAKSVLEPDEFWQSRVLKGATDPAFATFVAIHDGQMIGKASGFVDNEMTEPTVHLVGVYVQPAFRGAGIGVSAGVVTAVMRWARDAIEASQVRLYVTEVNGRAEAFYARLGFTRTGNTMPYPHDPSITEFEMLNAKLDSV